MLRSFKWKALVLSGVVSAFMAFGVPSALADDFHGIAIAKQCTSPVKVGDPYTCAVQALNIIDIPANDTLRVTGMSDVVHSAGGNVATGNILPTSQLVFTGAVVCTGGTGTGTSGDPYIGATSCLLPFGSSITTKPFTHYTVQANDFNLPNHQLTDTATVNWNDTCNSGSPNCTTDPQTNTAGASAEVEKLPSTTATDIHNAAHQVVTAVAVGSTVHDFVTVTGQPNNPAPSGNVNIDWFLNNTCTGQPAANSGSTGPLANGQFDATGFAFTVNSPGGRAFRAHYEGDATYLPSDGPCEPLAVVDANIQITPNGVNRVGQHHQFTAHVNVNSGSGFVSAPDGTQISFSIDSGPGGFTSVNPCTTAGGTGSCTIDLSSAVTGVTTVSAHTTLAVGGVSLTRHTDGTGANSGPATKTWVNAKIEIAPNATNEIGASHTFTVTLSKDTGTGAFVAAAGEHVDVALNDLSGAVHSAPSGSCTSAGANTDANGQCTITFTSNTAGVVTGHAESTLSVAGSAPFSVATNGVAPNSADAVKAFVDANIQIAPLSDNNPVSTNHTLTGHVNVNDGSGAGFVNAPAGTVISFALTNSGGASAAFVGPASCTVATGGSCSVVISSSTTGTTTVKASTTVVVGGVSLVRSTGDGKLGDSADAVKLWGDASARTDILNSQGTVILTAVAGTVVHDKVFVARSAGTPASVPNPTGSVVFHRYATINCSGAAVNQTVALTAGNPSTAESDTFAVTADMSYQAEYLGDANYPARTGACEPLTVTPVPQPAIAIVKNPKSQTVAVGGTATFTITVTNTGNVTLTDVNVVDPLSPLCNRTKADIPALASMAPAAAVTYTCTRPNVRAAFDNVATATGTPPTGPNVTASDTAPVTTKAVVVKKKVVKKKPKVVSRKKPKVTG